MRFIRFPRFSKNKKPMISRWVCSVFVFGCIAIGYGSELLHWLGL